MRHHVLGLLALLTFVPATLMADGGVYRFMVDLLRVQNDQVSVTCYPPTSFTSEEVTFVFPVVTPGTYEHQDWSRYVVEFKAFTESGRELPTRKSEDNQFVIERARELHHVEYRLDDSFDDRDTSKPTIFPPSGTCFQADTLFVLNHAGIIGYFDGRTRDIFQIMVQKSPRLTATSGLRVQRMTDSLDVYSTGSYDQLVDSPVMYSVADTTTFDVNGMKVLVAVAHPTKHDFDATMRGPIEATTKSIAKFLKTMPVDHYSFLFYLWNGDTTHVAVRNLGFGAWEHSYSSFYFLGARNPERGVQEIAAHEFLHILIPLNLHSEEIDHFNFRTPKMSKHLWLYEGVTEYFSDLALVSDSSVTTETFRSRIESKIRNSARLPKTFSMTTFSRNILADSNQKIYPVIYEIGAVNGFLLDILLRKESNGERGLLSLVQTLGEKYGPSTSFKDDSLFDIIERATSKNIGAYLRSYVDGRSSQLPYDSVLSMIGWRYHTKKVNSTWTYGFTADHERMQHDTALYIKASGTNQLGVLDGDRVVAVNGKPIDWSAPSWMATLFQPAQGDVITITILREGATVDLSGKASKFNREEKHVIEPVDKPTEAQLKLRHAVLGGS
jgi:predicted metalloprotease with PDZ domain